MWESRFAIIFSWSMSLCFEGSQQRFYPVSKSFAKTTLSKLEPLFAVIVEDCPLKALDQQKRELCDSRLSDVRWLLSKMKRSVEHLNQYFDTQGTI